MAPVPWPFPRGPVCKPWADCRAATPPAGQVRPWQRAAAARRRIPTAAAGGLLLRRDGGSRRATISTRIAGAHRVFGARATTAAEYSDSTAHSRRLDYAYGRAT